MCIHSLVGLTLDISILTIKGFDTIQEYLRSTEYNRLHACVEYPLEFHVQEYVRVTSSDCFCVDEQIIYCFGYPNNIMNLFIVITEAPHFRGDIAGKWILRKI